MTTFKLKKYIWDCPSCGIPHELVLAEAVLQDRYKWIKSTGLKWKGEMYVGEAFGENEPFECALCRTEFTYPDIVTFAEVVNGEPFKKEKEPTDEKPSGKSDS